MTVVVILAVMAALASAAVGFVLGTIFWGATLILPPSAVFGVLAACAAFPCFYMYFAQRV